MTVTILAAVFRGLLLGGLFALILRRRERQHQIELHRAQQDAVAEFATPRACGRCGKPGQWTLLCRDGARVDFCDVCWFKRKGLVA